MVIHHTLQNFFIYPLNLLHLFFYFKLCFRNPFAAATGIILLALPYLVGNIFYFNAPAPAWLSLAFAVNPIYCVVVIKLFLVDTGWRRIILGACFSLAFSYLAALGGFIVAFAFFGGRNVPAVAGAHLALYAVGLPLLWKYGREQVGHALDSLARERWYYLALMPMIIAIARPMFTVLYGPPGEPISPESLSLLATLALFYAQIYYFVEFRHRYWLLENQVQATERLLPMYEQYSRELAKRQNALAVQRHDFRHILGQLAVLAREEAPALAERIQTVMGVEESLRTKRLCDNPALNAVVSFYFSLAEEHGVRCTAEMAAPERLALPDAEIAMLAGNALDNCVKAARPLGADGWIKVVVKTPPHRIVLSFGNNFRPGEFAKGEGIGMTSLRLLVERYDGVMDWEAGDGESRLTLALNLEAAKRGTRWLSRG